MARKVAPRLAGPRAPDRSASSAGFARATSGGKLEGGQRPPSMLFEIQEAAERAVPEVRF
ncbi:MAG TPA: hypothetical protein VJB36_03570 [Methylomirabilota bacterium]|nr:hypothetical protein [Methylomirabilota bacterium]